MKPVGKNVIDELIAATSALRTQSANAEDYDQRYLEETEPMVKHAIEHIYSAMEAYNNEKGRCEQPANNENYKNIET